MKLVNTVAAIVSCLLLVSCQSGSDELKLSSTPSTTVTATPQPTQATPSPTVEADPTPTPQAKVTPVHQTWIGDQGLTVSDTAATGNFLVNDVAIATKHPGGRPVNYVIQVEDSVGIPARQIAEEIHAILDDDRGWSTVENVSFNLITDPSQADFVLTVASPATTDEACAVLNTAGLWSCRNGRTVNLNSDRWLYSTPSYAGQDLQTYRSMLVNHEVGHWLGHDHEYCPGEGLPAPTMQQQSMGLQGCVANPWPTVA